MRVHAWVGAESDVDEVDGERWVALCDYTVSRRDIAPDTGEPKCMDCVLVHGSRLATAQEVRGEQVREQTRRDLAAEAEAGDSAGLDVDTGDAEGPAGVGLPAGLVARLRQCYAARREL